MLYNSTILIIGGRNLNIQLLTNITYFGYFLIGIVSFIISPTLPVIIKDFDITIGIAGTIFAANAAGTFIGVLVGGYISDILGRKPVIILGCILYSSGFALTAATRNWIILLAVLFMTGVGRGFINTCFNALIAEINPHRRGAALNTLHGIYGVGCLIGPMLAGLVLSLNYGWRPVYYGAALIWVFFMLLIIPIKYPTVSRVKDKAIKEKINRGSTFKSIIISPVLIMLFFVSFIYNGAATGLVGWINTYLEGINFSVILGAGMVSVFYLGLTIGRFGCRYLSEKIGYSRTIMSCALGCFVFYPFTIFASSPIMIAAGVFFSGLFFSGLHPTGLAYANSLFPSVSGTVTGLLSTAMSLGAMSVPWLIGLVAEKTNFKVGFSISYILIIILVGVSISLLLYEKRRSTVKQV